MDTFIFKVLKSFDYASKGIVSGFQERNMQVHAVAMGVVLFLSFFFQISLLEWLFIILAIGLVISAELMNTAIEEVCNSIRDEVGVPYASSRRARDVAAGAVLVMALAASCIGVLIFFPRIWQLLMMIFP